MRPHMMQVPANLFVWQAEADCLPLEKLQEMVTKGLADFKTRLDEVTTRPVLSDHCPCGCGQPAVTVTEDTLIDMITAAVSVAVHLLGVAQRNPGGIWIMMPPAPSCN